MYFSCLGLDILGGGELQSFILRIFDVLVGNAMSDNIDQQLDANGLDCPLPLLKAKQQLNRMHSGEVLEVLATDPGSQRDFAVFAKQSGNVLLHSEALGEGFRYLIEKK